MPAKAKRVSVSVEPDVLARLGIDPARGADAGSLAGALARYADLFTLAVQDLDREWKPAVWKLLADVCRGIEFPAAPEASSFAHAAVADALRAAHRDRRVGEVYLLTPGERNVLTVNAAAQRADARVREVCEQLESRTAVHGAAVLAGVRWYWAHHTDPGVAHGAWWMPHQRVKWLAARKAPPAPGAPAPLSQPTLFDEVPDGEA